MTTRTYERAREKLAKHEAFYRCRCGHSFWKNLCNPRLCATCNHWVHCTSEEVFSNTAIASYTCCGNAFKYTWRFETNCLACSTPVNPVADKADMFGVVIGFCRRCELVSYEIDKDLSQSITCRDCRKNVAPSDVCSQEKLTQCVTIAQHPLRPATFLPFDHVNKAVIVHRAEPGKSNAGSKVEKKASVPFALPEEDE